MLTDTHTRTLCTLCLISDCEECRSATRLTTVAAIGRWEGMSQAADWREGPGPATPFWHENWNLLKNDYFYRNLWLTRCCEFQANLFMLWQVIEYMGLWDTGHLPFLLLWLKWTFEWFWFWWVAFFSELSAQQWPLALPRAFHWLNVNSTCL